MIPPAPNFLWSASLLITFLRKSQEILWTVFGRTVLPAAQPEPNSPTPQKSRLRHSQARRSASCLDAALSFVFAAAFLAPAAWAADTPTSVWNGGTTNWSTSTNWGSGVPSATISAKFSSAFTNQPTLTAASTSQGIWLATGTGQDVLINASSAQTLAITGTATLNSNANAGILLDDTANHNLTIGSNVATTLTNSTSFLVNEAATLTIQGGLTITAGNTLTLGGTNASGNTLISGNIANTTGALTVNTAGTATLTGTNAYSGATTVTAGILNIQNSSALGTSAVTVSSGGTLQLQGGTLTVSNTLTSLNGTGVSNAGALENVSGNNTVSSALKFGGSTTRINSDAGTLTLSNTTNITGGGNNVDLIFGGAGNIALAASIKTAGHTVTKDGSGTLTLTGTNSTYSGITTIKAGTVLAGSSVVFGNTNSILLGDTTGSLGASLFTNGAFTIGGSEGPITVQAGNTGLMTLGGNTDNNSTISSAVTLNHDLTVSQVTNAGANALSITGGITSGNAGSKTVTFAGPGNINVGTTGISDGGGGTLVVNVTGGKTTFNIANTYTGLTNITGGTLVEGVNNAISTGALTVNGLTAVFDLGASHTDTVGIVTLDGGGSITGTGTSALTSTGTFEMKSGSASAILAGAGIALNKTTSGTVALTGSNTYSGTTNVSGGTLNSAAANALGGTSGITVSSTGTLLLTANDTINNAATLTLNGNTSNNTLVLSGASEGSYSPTTPTAGLGALTLQSQSRLDFTQSTSAIVFGKTGATAFVDTSNFKLDIYNYIGDSTPAGNSDHLVFQQDMSTLTGDFEFWNGTSFVGATTSQLGSSGFWEITPLTAVPEPSTWLAAVLALSSIGFSQRKRVRACARAISECLSRTVPINR